MKWISNKMALDNWGPGSWNSMEHTNGWVASVNKGEVFDEIFNMANSRSDIEELVKQITIQAANEEDQHFRNLVENRQQGGVSQSQRRIDIREGFLDNMAAVLDPALKEWDVVEQRPIYQV